MKRKHGGRMPPVHPGEILLEDFMKPLGLSQYRVAKGINVPPRRINEIIQGKRAISVETALRLERYLGWPAQVWMNLQMQYEIQAAAKRLYEELDRIDLQEGLARTLKRRVKVAGTAKHRVPRLIVSPSNYEAVHSKSEQAAQEVHLAK
jgi:addiction module HigA family antidote